MTDLVTGNQIDIAAFDSGMSSPLLGSRFADKVENVGRNIVGGLQAASQDQEGIGDDILRAGGKVLQGVGAVAEAPVIKQGLQLLDAPFHYGSKLAGAAAERMGVDPRLGEWAVRAGELATGIGAAKKAPKVAGKVTNRLAQEATEFAFRNADPQSVAGMVYRTGGGMGPVPKHLIEKPRDVIGLKENILDWYKKELKNRNLEVKDYHKIKREKFGDINVAGSDREISQIGKALKADDPSLMSLPKVTTRRKGRLKRTKETAAPEIKELHAFADEVGIPATTEDLLEFKKWTTTSFKSVQDAAKKTSRFRGEYHAGHTTAAQSKTLTAQSLYREGKLGRPATAGSSATIELGVDNIRGSNKAIHDINPIAARQAGVPTTWAETFKQWWKIKKGQPQKSYFTDFTNAERQIIEAIPYNAKRSEVMETFNNIYKNRQATNPDLSQYSAWSKDLKRGVEETFTDLRFNGF